jgi:hypothetical protein
MHCGDGLYVPGLREEAAMTDSAAGTEATLRAAHSWASMLLHIDDEHHVLSGGDRDSLKMFLAEIGAAQRASAVATPPSNDEWHPYPPPSVEIERHGDEAMIFVTVWTPQALVDVNGDCAYRGPTK